LPPELSAPTPRQPGTAGYRFFLKEDRALVITYARGLLWVPVLMPLIIFCWQESHNGLRFLSSPSLSNIAADFDAYFVGLTLVLEAFVGLVALGLYANYQPDVRLFRYGAATRGRISRMSRDSDQGPTVVEFEFVTDRGKQRFGHYSPPAAFDPPGAGETVGVLFSDDVKYVAVFQSGKKMIRAATGKLPQDWAGKTWFERFLGPAMAAWVLTCMVGPLAGWIACSDGSSFGVRSWPSHWHGFLVARVTLGAVLPCAAVLIVSIGLAFYKNGGPRTVLLLLAITAFVLLGQRASTADLRAGPVTRITRIVDRKTRSLGRLSSKGEPYFVGYEVTFDDGKTMNVDCPPFEPIRVGQTVRLTSLANLGILIRFEGL